jgi:hypothetical protein
MKYNMDDQKEAMEEAQVEVKEAKQTLEKLLQQGLLITDAISIQTLSYMPSFYFGFQLGFTSLVYVCHAYVRSFIYTLKQNL